MGVAMVDINQSWIVNFGIFYHLGYFPEVADD